MTKFVNLTPHAVNLYDGESIKATFQPEGLARATCNKSLVFTLDDTPVYTMSFGQVEGLPESAPADTYFIVSAITAQAAKATSHPLSDKLLVVADPVRNDEGQIIGCRSFSIV